MTQGLAQVKKAVVKALTGRGLQAVTAFAPDWAKDYRAPVAAVGLRTGESQGGALHSYLGSQVDRDTQRYRELYGMRLTMTLSVDLYAPASLGAAGCDEALETLHQAVLHGLPSGLRPESLTWDETVWDRDNGMFLRRCSLTTDAFFTAETGEEGLTIFSDFILKGTVTQ